MILFPFLILLTVSVLVLKWAFVFAILGCFVLLWVSLALDSSL